jgi:hypothetical protein
MHDCAAAADALNPHVLGEYRLNARIVNTCSGSRAPQRPNPNDADLRRQGGSRAPYVPIGRVGAAMSGDVRGARSVRGGQAQIGRYGRPRSSPARVKGRARIAGSERPSLK